MRMEAEQFERAVIEHRRMVFSIALHTLRERALAEEITQDVFLALFQHGDRIESAAHLVHWLRRVTARRCIDQLRRQRHRRWLPWGGNAAGGSGGERVAGRSCEEAASPPRGDPLLAARLERLIRALPAGARVALVLRYQEDLEAAEIGRILGLTENAVKRKLRHALAQLRLRLGPPAPGGRGRGSRAGARDKATPAGNTHACAGAGPGMAPAKLEQR